MKQFVYRVDAQDRIQHMDSVWLAFALENGASSLTERLVKGTSLWDHVTDASTRHLYQIILARVRETGRPVTIPFRCDHPERRRFMALGVLPQPDRSLEFKSYLLREEPAERVGLLDASMPRTTELLRMCCWCKKVDTGEAGWQEPVKAVQLLKLFDTPAVPLISHVACPACEADVLRRLDGI